ncbi:hypothetical protein L3V83_07045 [Thiotrichales bacterium 19X7-9]|nr:hypothetical protein [Thiotrichales bacterium 19X7-9]
MFNNVLILCVGNICRSPYAEGYFKKNINENIQVASAGIKALIDQPAAKEAQSVSEYYGFDIREHKARQVNMTQLIGTDLLLAVSSECIDYLKLNFPFAIGKAHLLGKWLNNIEIIDPYNKPKDAFEKMAVDINSCMDIWIKKVWRNH